MYDMLEDIKAAINNNDSAYLKKVLRHYDYSSVSDESALSLMELAIEKSHLDVLITLIESGGDEFDPDGCIEREIDGYGSHIVPLLIFAISISDIELVEALIEKGADLDFSIIDCFSPLGYAFYMGKEKIVNYLIKKGARLEETDISLLQNHSTSLNMEDIINFFNDTKKIRNEITEALTEQSKHTKKGSKPKDCTVKVRKYHPFVGERERQILRHISTQLYFAFKPNNADLVEIQAMHLICSNKSNIFIAVNEFSVGSIFKNMKSGDFEEKLTTQYTTLRTTEEKERSNRYAKKLRERMFGEEEWGGKSEDKEDLKKAKYVKEIIRKKKISLIKLDYSNTSGTLSEESIKGLTNILNQKNDNIFFVQVKNCSYEKRHAEEFLCDIVAVAKSIFGINDIHSCIGGKKRPCLGCTGRMEYESVSEYGSYPGLFFKHTVQNQPADVAATTFGNFSGNIYLSSVCKEAKAKGLLPVSDFDSGSSESSEESSSDSEENNLKHKGKKF